MADNIQLNSGTGGAIIAADDIISVWYEIIKLAYGALDTATLVTTTSGLPVQNVAALPAGTNNIGDVDVLTIAAGDNNIGNVDIVTVPAPLNVTGGGVELGALRVTIASDSTGVVSVDDNAGALTVDWAGVAPPIGAGLEATALRVTLATDSTGLVSVDDNGGSLTVDVGTALPAGTNNIGDVDILTIAAGDNNIGNVDIASAIPAGTNLIGDVGLGVRTSGGVSIFRTLDLDETEEDVKTSAGQVYGIVAINTTAALLYLKFYNAAAATVVVGTTTPVMTLPVPGNNDTDGAGFVLTIPQGIAFGTAICVAATTGVADADVGAPGTNALIVQVFYA